MPSWTTMSGSPLRSASSSVSGASPGRLCSAISSSVAPLRRLDADPLDEPMEEGAVLVQADRQRVAEPVLGLLVLVEQVAHGVS